MASYFTGSVFSVAFPEGEPLKWTLIQQLEGKKLLKIPLGNRELKAFRPDFPHKSLASAIPMASSAIVYISLFSLALLPTGHLEVDCSSAATSDEISSALKNASWPSTQLHQFLLQNNTEVDELSEGVFADLSFNYIYVNNTALKAIHPSVILTSRNRLQRLSVYHSHLLDFPFHILPTLWRLRTLELQRNSLMTIPAIQSDSLHKLDLSRNSIAKIEEDGWATPNLRVLSINHNPLSKFPSAVIKGLAKLEIFWCTECNLGPTLPSGLLQFRSKDLKLVSLWKNNISKLEPNAITGLGPNSSVALSNNNISVLAEESFRPILEVLSLGDGGLHLEDSFLNLYFQPTPFSVIVKHPGSKKNS
ncbi:unnamed protein product [Darwinula stevensoni]|uniref:Uncharacterized protein n=1 Tax=Darwinula stevensoni TaxID=69355 RepID=A0A7R8XIE7_9CRUS|nr:unnamed protein product [Darwinula stevensoni]CAG0891210.1 unnamed protein product [Darwinula stevensoni]